MDVHFIDIIFFAMVAAFLVLRLRSVLGRRTGEERERPDPFHPKPAEGGGDKSSRFPTTASATPARRSNCRRRPRARRSSRG